MAAGCKPAAPCELRRFESSPVHQDFLCGTAALGCAPAQKQFMSIRQKLVIALTAYAVLAIVAWQTLTEERLRLFVFAILGFFALKSVLHWRRDEQQKHDGNPVEPRS